VQRFFGLTPNDKNLFLEQIFALMYYSGFTYTEAYFLPVWQRQWFIERVNKELKDANDKDGNRSRALHHNTASAREYQNMARSQVPARMRRFS